MSDNRELAAELMQEYADKSQYVGTLENPTFTVEGGNPACGDKIKLAVYVDKDVLKTSRFIAQGCLISRASAGLMSELVDNKPIHEVLALSISDLEHGLGTDFRSRVKCALLPLFVLQEGLRKFVASPITGASFKVPAPRNLGM